MSIMNPAVYETGSRCIRQIMQNPDLISKREGWDELCKTWSSPFTAMSLMNNRNSPLHRDNSTGYSRVVSYTVVSTSF